MEKTSDSITVTKGNDIYTQIPEVSLETGCFKYIYIKLTIPELKEDILFVRGSKLAYHMYIYEAFQEELKEKGKDIIVKTKTTENKWDFQNYLLECLGGGRIEHDEKEKTIKVYGYSEAFGAAKHSEVVKHIQKCYSDYKIEQS